MKLKTFFCYFFLFLCISIVFYQGTQTMWKDHLITDFYTFRERAAGNFSGNEYQPGALVFFRLFVPFANQDSLEPFKNAVLFANIFIIFLIALLMQKLSKPESSIILGLAILFSGPILLFRFELLVIFFVIVSFYFLKKGNLIIASVFLALATMVKVYPIVYLPYFFLIAYRKIGAIKSFSRTFLIFLITTLMFLLVFMPIYNFDLNQLTNSLQFHTSKPVGAEGFWSVIISGLNILSNKSLPSLTSRNGTQGISDQSLILPLWLINNLWIFVLICVYIWYFAKKKMFNKFDSSFLLILTMIPVIFLKLSSPQYLLWFIILLPLINFYKFKNEVTFSFLLFASLITAYLNQIIYPLHYVEFLYLFKTGENFYLFYILIFKNIFLLLAFIFLMKITFFENSKSLIIHE